MLQRGERIIRVLAIAAAAAMLVCALPASVATAGRDDACRVYNTDREIGRNSLQRAVWDAGPSDHLLVQGTCVGTTIVRKDLEIGWVEASSMDLGSGTVSDIGKPRVRTGDWRPALVIDPKVDHFRILPGLTVIGGIVIGDTSDWIGPRRPVSDAWKGAFPSTVSTLPAPTLRYCRVRNDGTTAEFKLGQPAVNAASKGSHLSLRGACSAGTVIDEDLSISGWRLAVSGKALGSEKVSRQDSGPPTIGSLAIDDEVDDFVLKRVRISKGLDIRDVTP